MIWYGVWHLSLGKSTSPLVRSYGWIYCAKRGWVYAWIAFNVCDGSPLGQLLFLLVFPWIFEVIGRKSCEEVEEFSLNCKSYVNDNLNVVVLATTLGFLTGSFLMEPWTKMHNREREKDYEILLAMFSCELKLLAYVCEKIVGR